jgi:hypothetical protein
MITVDSGSTTFSMLIPKVTLQNTTGASAHIHSEGITTVHRFSLVPMFDLGQDELYTVMAMRGTASSVIIPLKRCGRGPGQDPNLWVCPGLAQASESYGFCDSCNPSKGTDRAYTAW